MSRSTLAAGMLLGMIAASTGPTAWADDEVIDTAALPAAVREVAEVACPGATWTKAKREVGKGSIAYELEGTATSGGPIEVDIEADTTGRTAKVVKVEMRAGPTSGASAPPLATPPTKGRSVLWPIGLGVLAVLGLILKAIFADAFEAIGVAIARALGADRVGKAVAGRLSRGRATNGGVEPGPLPQDRPA